MESPLIYNLFPRLVGAMDHWLAHAQRVRQMGFDWLFLNPIQYPGFSGSLYAIKDFYRLNPLFESPKAKDQMEALRRTLAALHKEGLRVMMDLVINHTSKDSVLVEEHPEWYELDEDGEVKSPSAIDPADSRKVTVWGDLAEIDNAESSDREALWAYWTALVEHYLDLGFDGFRCDAAYKVPAELWHQLIGAAERRRPEVRFFAETLGCRLPEVRKLKDAGFDFLFNSSKWWNFDAPWALEQHAEFGVIAPSISFPESHDTPRLMQETSGLQQVQKQRYAFAAVFSAGLMMPIGYEFGFKRRMNVVQTRPEDWEKTSLDLSPFIRRVNQLKRSSPVFSAEGQWEALTPLDRAVVVLRKTAAGVGEAAVVVVNKDWRAEQDYVLPPLAEGPHQVIRPFRDDPPAPLTESTMHLEPAEVALLLPRH